MAIAKASPQIQAKVLEALSKAKTTEEITAAIMLIPDLTSEEMELLDEYGNLKEDMIDRTGD